MKRTVHPDSQSWGIPDTVKRFQRKLPSKEFLVRKLSLEPLPRTLSRSLIHDTQQTVFFTPSIAADCLGGGRGWGG